MPAAFRRLKATESGRVTPMSAFHASFIFKVVSKTAVTSQPFSHQNTRCTTLTQSVAGRSQPSRAANGAWRTPQLSQTRPSKQVFVN